jgi:bifunctional oligoribonuclease and PAP phosphatase NrnA
VERLPVRKELRGVETKQPAEAVEPLDQALDRAARVLSEASQVALACHVNPDPDAAGSMLGLAGFLASRGARVVCSWGNRPFRVPRWLGVLDGSGMVVEPGQFPAEPPLMVTLDTASPDRLGALAPNATHAAELVVIDHHRTNPGFGSIMVLDPAASSTAELVFRLVERMGGGLRPQDAACLYAGIVTDTGRFQYEATTPETLRVAAALRTYPFDHARMAQALFEDGSLGNLRVMGSALERLEHLPDVDMVWTYVTQTDVAGAKTSMEETDDLIDVVRTAREADVACVMKQQRDGRFKVSLRSRGATDVGAVAAALGGGGHRLAAGYTSQGGLEDAVRDLVGALRGQDVPA